MQAMSFSGRGVALLVGLALMAGCQAQGPSSGATGTTGTAGTTGSAGDAGLRAEAALTARIRDEIGEARCDSDAQCHTLAVGEKACGGPAAYLAWSGTAARGSQLEAWAAELATLQRKRAASSGLMSNCQFNPDPGAVCVQQRCLLRTGASGGVAR